MEEKPTVETATTAPMRPQPTIDESQRQAYLEAMGIESWVPRTVLPGAAPSCYFAWDWDGSAASMAEGVAPPPAAVPGVAPMEESAPAPVMSRESARAELVPATAAPAPVAKAVQPAPASPVRERALASTDTAEVPEFHLACMVFSAGVVLTELPLKMRALGEQHLTLLVNLLTAVSGRRETLGKISYFRWPMIRTRGVDQSAAVAQLTLQRWLDKLRPEQQPALLVLGEQAIRHCLQLDPEHCDWRQLHTAQGWDAVAVSHGLHALLNIPSLKAETWQHVQALRQHLATQNVLTATH
ncbi:hypothetical protein QCD60_15510 [Pokkaliibacter sp. MBI-7]|uniref:hypothetical protein n=1 Tax=Pokkaliibacter sp. MBI-7 TaxID=3040600 RepID=UPI002446BDB8|nr:hypothetical protein [Pokkaliibacter sp. MBI-7]MDH2433973.1 hypothetical protein [Pokkaliibacter sp. MBI-7]